MLKNTILLGPVGDFNPKNLAKLAILLGPVADFGPKRSEKTSILLGLYIKRRFHLGEIFNTFSIYYYQI